MSTDKRPTVALDDTLHTMFIDGLEVSTRKDGVAFLRFTVHLPEGRKEQTRLMVTKEGLRTMANTICRALDYYPTKDDAAEKSSSSKQ